MRHPQLTSSILQGIRFEFPSVDVVQLLHVLRDLLLQTDNIFTLLQDPSLSPAAVSTTQLCITTIIHNTKTVLYQIQTLLPTSLSNNTDQCTHLVTDLMQSVKYLHTKLWAQLSFPHATQYRKHIYIILLIAQQTLLHIAPYTNPAPLKARRFSKPDRTSQPSIADQVVHRPLQIIDPYIIALQSNYYYPISADSSNMPEDENEIDMIQVRPSSPPKDGKPPARTPVTVEHSVEAISDVLREMEADDPPTQSEAFTTPKIPAVKSSSYRHRFAMYRRNTGAHAPGSPSFQLALFKSFTKCIKLADHSAQILPVRNDVKIYPLSHSDQITNLEAVGLPNYFKAYRQNRKSLSGDFHISTNLAFDDLMDHQAVLTWLSQNGYSIIRSSCQTADMVRIGFLSRVRTFTFRDDLHSFITNISDWKTSPFHFRIYFDTFVANNRGKLAHVLMVDVDRPSVEQAMMFFQKHYNGDEGNSPNGIPYMFFPLSKKTYDDEERLRIIQDHLHYTDKDSVVALRGLNDLDTVIPLVTGIHTTIRKLLLSVPAPGTLTNKLFLQIEKQSSNDWLLCCFSTADSAKVTVRLGQLEDVLKRAVLPEAHSSLFRQEHTISYSGRVAPVPRGRAKMPRLHVPSETSEYARQSMQKLYKPTPKRLATELEEPQMQTESLPTSTIVTPLARQAPNFTSASYCAAARPVDTLTSASSMHTASSSLSRATSTLANDPIIQHLQQATQSHGKDLQELQSCYRDLVKTTDSLSAGMENISKTIDKKFTAICTALEKLTATPTTASPTRKVAKDHHGPSDAFMED